MNTKSRYNSKDVIREITQKVQEATAFRRKKKIEEISIEKLSCSTKRAFASNIINILDQYLDRK